MSINSKLYTTQHVCEYTFRGIVNTNYLWSNIYDREAPIRVGATQTPPLVRILCTLLLTGLTQAASLESRVMKPEATANLLITSSSSKIEQAYLVVLSRRSSFLGLVEIAALHLWDVTRSDNQFTHCDWLSYSQSRSLRNRPCHQALSPQEVGSTRYLRPCRLSK